MSADRRGVSPLSGRISARTVSRIGLVPMLLFILSPVIVCVYTLFHRGYGDLREFHYLLADGFVYPLVALFSLVFFLLTLLRRVRPALRPVPAAAFCFAFTVFWILLSTYRNGWDLYSLVGDSYRLESVLRQLGYFLLFFIVSALIGEEAHRLLLARAMVLSGIVVALCGLFFWHGLESDPSYDWGGSLTAVFFNINHYGYYLTVAIMLSAGLFVAERSRIMKTVCLLSVALNAVVLAFNNTLGALVACTAAFLLQMILYRLMHGGMRRELFLPLLLFAAAYLTAAAFHSAVLRSMTVFADDVRKILSNAPDADEAGSRRWAIWTATLRLIPRSPLFGYGMEGIVRNGLVDYVRNTRPHNEFLQYALFYGLPAGISYTAGCLCVFLEGLRARQRLDELSAACLLAAFGYLVSSFFGNTMFYTAPYLFLFLGLGYHGVRAALREGPEEAA